MGAGVVTCDVNRRPHDAARSGEGPELNTITCRVRESLPPSRILAARDDSFLMSEQNMSDEQNPNAHVPESSSQPPSKNPRRETRLSKSKMGFTEGVQVIGVALTVAWVFEIILIGRGFVSTYLAPVAILANLISVRRVTSSLPRSLKP